MQDKVMIAMSGGVDSAAAAVLLLDADYNAAGGTLHFFKSAESDKSISDARDMAYKLGIPHFVYDAENEFKNKVMDFLAESYIAGDTPNPCVRCNAFVKFPVFLKAAEKNGYPLMATGHYARIEFDSGSKRWLLKCGKDKAKDQSYFLYALTQDIMSHTLFPLGELTKDEAREIVRMKGLKAASRPESQDICFLPDGDYKSFIEREYGYKSTEGDFRDTSGSLLGRHNGAIGFTRGQRRGLGVSAASRLYVISKDMSANTVILGREPELLSNRIYIKDINLISTERIDSPLIVEAKIRYSRNTASARLTMIGANSAVLEFDTAQRAPAPGQAAVFYDGDTVIGGGTITERQV